MPIINNDNNFVTFDRLYDDEKIGVEMDLQTDNTSNMPRELENSAMKMIKTGRNNIKKIKPFYDYNTKNKSFLETYNDLYNLGIKNNKFFLRLFDKDLIGIDPFISKLLTTEMRLKIFIECVRNPWYFLREICRIPEDGQPIEIGGGTEYKLDRNNAATWYLYLNGIPFYKSKPRQRGKTQDIVAKFNYAYHFGALASQFLFFSKDQELSKQNLYRLKCQRDMMPDYLQMKVQYLENGAIDKGLDNVTMIINPVTKNKIAAMPKAISSDGAMKLGRGSTAGFQNFDEFDFIPYIETVLNASVFAFARAAENAKKNHSLFLRCYSSTPGDLGTRDGAYASKLVNTMLHWEDKFFDIPINEFEKKYKTTGFTPVVFVEHTWKQLKLSTEWYNEQCSLVSYNEEVIMREINLQRIAGLSTSPFRRADIIYLNSHKREPIQKIDLSKNLCTVNIYEKLHRDWVYIISVDPSEGLGLDNNAFTLVNSYTQEVAAEFKSPYISQRDLFFMMCKFMDTHCPRCMIIVESNRGRELINYFIDSKYRYQLYYDIDKLTSKIVENTNEYGAMKQAALNRRAFGFSNTKTTRPLLWTILENLVEEEKDKLFTQYVVQDIVTLERKPTGRIEHSAGNHDDNIISYLIALYVYYNASNLEEFNVIRGASPPGTEVKEETREDIKAKFAELVPQMKPEMQEYFKEFMEEKNPVDEANKYYREIQLKSGYVGYEEDIRNNRFYTPEELSRRQQLLDDQIFESNFIDEKRYKVNMDDLIQ